MNSEEESLLPPRHLGLVENPTTEAQVLQYLLSARAALAQVRGIQDAVSIKNATRAVEELTKQIEVASEIQHDATELRIRAERTLGLAMKEMPKNKGTRSKTDHRDDISGKFQELSKELPGGWIIDPPGDRIPALKELGIRKDEADRCRKLARLPEDHFEAILTDVRTEAITGKRKQFSTNAVIAKARELERGDSESQFSPIIKPSDNWNFSNVKYGRIDEASEEENWGYIPGELYANCFWYYVKPDDLVVAPMAGAGQVWRVYEARAEWMGQHAYDFQLKMFDLTPRGIYKHLIGQNDLTKAFPVENPDYIVMDVPYYGMVEGQYSDKGEDLANMPWGEWKMAMETIAFNCASAQQSGKLCTIISPNYRDIVRGQVIMVVDVLRSLWNLAGYTLFDMACSSRRIQQSQTPNMARLNNQAKASRVMLTDISYVLTFKKV